MSSFNGKEFFAYSASAGSGKTYALALRYIALLFKNQSPTEILAATFTKKAANEMKQRVLKLLKNLDKEDDFLNSLSSEYNLSKDEILANQPKVLAKFLKLPNYIVTLDSFFSSILRSSALQIGLEPDFKVKQSIHDNLNEHFVQRVENYGKSNSLVKLSINLNKRKSQDLVELYNNLFNLDALLPEYKFILEPIKNIEQDIVVLREEILELLKKVGASNSAIKGFSEINFKKFITKDLFKKESLSEHNYYKKAVKAEPQIDTLFLELKEKIANYHKALEASVLHYLFELYSEYKGARLESVVSKGELDFSDILYYTYRLLSSEITKDFLYFKLDTKFKHILLDEFQDTSALQFLILKPLIDEIFAGVGQSDFRTFFYVGDIKQSLYRFRGGVEELFGYVGEHYNINIANLDKNYRSAKLLVEQVNKWFVDKIAQYVPQIPNSKEQGFIEVRQSEELLDSAKSSIEFLISKGVALSDIAILVFANKDGVATQEYLNSFGIDSILKTSSSLRSNPKVAALIGVLEYLLTGHRVYVEPFLQKIGLEYKDDIFKDYRVDISPFATLDRLIREYKYFSNDLNILKLLEFASNFNTIVEFLDEFKGSNIELAKSTKEGLQIMTIHGSKGLEFKYVIVLDRFSKGAPNRDMLLFENSSPIKIDKIYYKYSKKELFVSAYAKALEKEKNLQIRDKLNLLYVALTRAELGLIVHKKEKNSEFDLIDLEPIKLGEVLPIKRDIEQKYLELNSKINSYGKQESADVNEEESVGKDYSAIYFGEALHYAMELLDFKDKNSLDSAIEAVENRYGLFLEKEAISTIKQRVEKVFESKISNLIKDATLFKEQPLVYKQNFYKLDLLAKFDDKMAVLDYKSSKKFQKKHIKQVKNYIEALKDISSQEVEGYIVYLLDKELEIVTID